MITEIEIATTESRALNIERDKVLIDTVKDAIRAIEMPLFNTMVATAIGNNVRLSMQQILVAINNCTPMLK